MVPPSPASGADRRPFLPDSVYLFANGPIAIRSDSRAVLEYIRSLYGSFLAGTGPTDGGDADGRARKPFVITVSDRTSAEGKLRITDDFGSTDFPCDSLCSLAPPDNDIGGDPYSPLAYVQRWLLFRVALLDPDRLFVHGGALSFAGGAVVLPGPSGSGKTTLCLKLLTRGFKLLSDEIAYMDPTDRIVAPFPRAVRLTESTRRMLDIPCETLRHDHDAGRDPAHWLLDPGHVYGAAYGLRAELRAVIFLQGLGEAPRIEPVSSATALFSLLKLSIRPPSDPAAELFKAAPLLDGVACRSLVLGDLDETASLIESELGDPGSTQAQEMPDRGAAAPRETPA